MSGTEDSGNALTAVGFPDGSSASVYKADAFDPAKPEYRVRYWDKEGNYTDTNVQINGVDPRNASYLEMLAYTTYSDVEGFTKNAFGDFMNATGGVNGNITYDSDSINEKKDYMSMIKEFMQLQYDANNLSGYVIFALREKNLNSTELVDARQLSDGTLRCIAVLTAVLICEPGSIVMIEELDNGIHPARVYKLIEQLIAIGKERNIDIIITTHNATLLNSYKKDELVGVSVVYRDNDRGTSKIKSFIDIEDFPAMLTTGGLGNAMIDETLLDSLKQSKSTKDYSWLGV